VKALVVVGTRPEAIKLAPLILELERRQGVVVSTCLSGQHQELLDEVVSDFGLSVSHRLDPSVSVGPPHQMLANLVPPLSSLVEEEHPDWVVVQGDTTTALAGAMAASLLEVPVAHVEAGLRSGDRRHPFPEELNRTIISACTDLHLVPTATAEQNLLREGHSPASVVNTGNTVIDAMAEVVRSGVARIPDCLAQRRPNAPLVLVTVHRRESHGAPLVEIAEALRLAANMHPDVDFVLPVHPNPAVGPTLHRALAGCSNVMLCSPLRYRELAGVLAEATLVITDSGGLQEEAPAMDVPVLVLRETTERPEGVECGAAQLVGRTRERIVPAVSTLLGDAAVHAAMAAAPCPYGDGRASERIADLLLARCGEIQIDLRSDSHELLSPLRAS
jgi:UDP-N-acetylglucosamine 2-epimerase (non-hydrolysing)